MSKLDETIITIVAGMVVKNTYRNLLYAFEDVTTTPHGWGGRYFIEQSEHYALAGEQFDTREEAEEYAEEIEADPGTIAHRTTWGLWTWGKTGQHRKCLRTYDTEAEAQAALDDIHLERCHDCPLLTFDSVADAEAHLQALRDEAA